MDAENLRNRIDNIIKWMHENSFCKKIVDDDSDGLIIQKNVDAIDHICFSKSKWSAFPVYPFSWNNNLYGIDNVLYDNEIGFAWINKFSEGSIVGEHSDSEKVNEYIDFRIIMCMSDGKCLFKTDNEHRLDQMYQFSIFKPMEPHSLIQEENDGYYLIMDIYKDGLSINDLGIIYKYYKERYIDDIPQKNKRA